MGLTHKFLRLLTSFCGRKPVKSIKSPYFWFSVLRDVRIEVSRSLKLSDGGRETIKSRMTSLWILKCGVGCIWSSIRGFLVVYREDVPTTQFWVVSNNEKSRIFHWDTKESVFLNLPNSKSWNPGMEWKKRGEKKRGQNQIYFLPKFNA